ncbi:MAG: sulfotransferase family protein [Acidimicrobiia bacterium]|nr:sulfotransferase family protein [Acidimicrobiia bacterium]
MSESVTRVNMISGPRNISTAMMYSFRSRADTTVIDEPLYAHYLVATGIEHPGRDVTMSTLPVDGDGAIGLIMQDCDTPVFMVKNMAHHISGVGLGLNWLDDMKNFFLIREPDQVITSLIKNLPNPTPSMTGLPQQAELVDHLVKRGQEPIVVSSRRILEDPEGQLRYLCERLGIGWDSAMLSWEAGPKPEDGTWGVHWYARLHESTGFEPYTPKEDVVPERLHDVLAVCEEAFTELEKYLAPSS